MLMMIMLVTLECSHLSTVIRLSHEKNKVLLIKSEYQTVEIELMQSKHGKNTDS